MMPSRPQTSKLSKVRSWISDLVAVPRRVKRIAHALDEGRDPRPVCRSCGTGRIGSLRAGPDIFTSSVGTCSKCGARFSVDDNGAVGKLLEPARRH